MKKKSAKSEIKRKIWRESSCKEEREKEVERAGKKGKRLEKDEEREIESKMWERWKKMEAERLQEWRIKRKEGENRKGNRKWDQEKEID